jgi:hypothetical protein
MSGATFPDPDLDVITWGSGAAIKFLALPCSGRL